MIVSTFLIKNIKKITVFPGYFRLQRPQADSAFRRDGLSLVPSKKVFKYGEGDNRIRSFKHLVWSYVAIQYTTLVYNKISFQKYRTL